MGKNAISPSTPEQADDDALDPSQELALAALLAGKTYGEAATAAGVHRGTVWRWLTGDPRFIARYNAGRREIADRARAGLLTLGQLAIKAVQEALEGDDPALRFKAAVKTLELLGVGREPPSGSTDPAEIALDLEKAETDRLHRADMNRLFRDLAGHRSKDPTEAGAKNILLKALGG
jgi:hypothetical protein